MYIKCFSPISSLVDDHEPKRHIIQRHSFRVFNKFPSHSSTLACLSIKRVQVSGMKNSLQTYQRSASEKLDYHRTSCS